MRIKVQRVKAFSLNEMMVVLLITTIVVGMAFSVLNLVQRQMGSIKNIYEVKTEANKLRQALWIDFNQYSTVIYYPKKEQLFFGNELTTKTYDIGDNHLIREKDTFNIQTESLVYYFNNKAVEIGEIDAIEIKTSKASGHQRIFVYKNNTPTTYLNQ